MLKAISKSVKSVKLGFITFGTLGALLGSAEAANIITGGASKQDCYDTNCEFGRFGVGGGYYGFQGNNANVDNYIGYVSFGIKEVYKARFQGEFDILLGGGKSEIKGSTFPQGFRRSADSFVFEPVIKLGVNVLTKKAPLFVNALVGVEGYRSGFGDTNRFYRTIGFTGLELNGEIPAGDKLRITYGAGYSWIFGASYNYDDTRAKVKGSISNYAVNANLGFEYDLPKGVYVYTKLIGKYQHIDSASSATYNGVNVSYPQSKGFAGMLEVGLGF